MCRLISLVVEEMAQNIEEVAFYKVDVDAVPDLAAECNITSVSFFLLKNADLFFG